MDDKERLMGNDYLDFGVIDKENDNMREMYDPYKGVTTQSP